MDDRQLFESLLQLAEFRRAVRETRMAQTWAITLGLWAGLAGAIYYVNEHPLPVAIVGMVAAGIIAFHLFIDGSFFRRNERDSNEMYYLYERAQGMIAPEAPVLGRRIITRWSFLREERTIIDLVPTCTLCVLLVLTASHGVAGLSPT